MTAVAIFEAVVILVLVGVVYAVTEIFKEQLNESRKREHETRIELFQVLGQTDVVSVSLNDQRPPGRIHYLTEEDEIRLSKESA